MDGETARKKREIGRTEKIGEEIERKRKEEKREKEEVEEKKGRKWRRRTHRRSSEENSQQWSVPRKSNTKTYWLNAATPLRTTNVTNVSRWHSV